MVGFAGREGRDDLLRPPAYVDDGIGEVETLDSVNDFVFLAQERKEHAPQLAAIG